MGVRISAGWPLVLLLSCAAVVAYMDRLILSVLFIPLSRDLSLSSARVSVLQGSSFAFVYALAGLPLGLIADRFNRRNSIIAGIFIWCGATIAGGFATGFVSLAITRILTGLGEAAPFPAATSIVGDSISQQHRGLALSTFAMGQMLGGGAAVAVGGWLLDLAQGHRFDAVPVLGHLPAWGMVLVLATASCVGRSSRPWVRWSSPVTLCSPLPMLCRPHSSLSPFARRSVP